MLADYAADAETAEVYLNDDPANGSEFNYQWHGINHAGDPIVVQHTIVDITGHDGQSTKALDWRYRMLVMIILKEVHMFALKASNW